MNADPYDDIAREVDAHLGALRPQAHAYVVSLNSSSPAAGPSPATPTRDELDAALDELDATLKDLDDSVKAVEMAGPSAAAAQFGLSQELVHNRRAFVNARKNELTRMRGAVRAAGAARREGPAFVSIPIGDENSESYQRDMEMEREHQALLMRDQDAQLDSVITTVQNLRDQAAVMGTELEEHVELLQDLDDRVDRTQSKLKLGMQRVRWILKKNEEKASNWCIGILTVVLFILLFLVLLA
ncbi:uncharacterized protein V1518DRAFT_408019 [Limtongia smithiae]|uniref:uncharacterized protein n=1 Tax=Limtongia smithiae TaxID=1125753 RepID=UPI0034CD336E